MERLLTALVLLLSLALLVPAADKPVTDDEIYDQVRMKLANDLDVKGGGIEVKVQAGVVELTGTVRTEKARAKAEKVAKKVKGVQRVVNQLRVARA